MSKQDLINKLKYIPIFELAILLEKLSKSSKPDLKSVFTSLNIARRKNPDKYFTSLKLKNFQDIFSKFGDSFPEKELTELYSQYADTYQPSLFLYYLTKPISISDNNIKLKTKLNSLFTDYDVSLKSETNPDIKEISVRNINSSNEVLEIYFTYLHKIDYTDPESEELEFVYGLKRGFIWIALRNKALVLGVNNLAIASIISHVLEKLLSCSVNKYKIPKQVGNKLFGFDTIKRANYLEANPLDERYAQKKSVSDNHLSKKEEGQTLDARCDRSSATHNIKLRDRNKTIIVNEYGHMKIYDHLRKSDLQDWVFEKITSITDYVDDLSNNDLDIWSKIVDISQSRLLPLTSDKAREVFSNIATAVFKCLKKNLTGGKINTSVLEANRSLKDFFTPLFIPVCSDCDSYDYVHTCGAINSAFLDGTQKLKCSSCNEMIESCKENLFCVNDDSHVISDSISDNILLIANPNFINLCNSISEDLNLNVKVPANLCIKVTHNFLEVSVSNKYGFYNFDECDNFSTVPKLDDLDNNFKKTQLSNLSFSTEKCPEYGADNCRSCIATQHGLCLQRLIACYVTSPNLNAHSPSEYGDLTFQLSFNKQSYSFVGLAKASKNKPEHVLTTRNDSDLIPQFLDSATDSRVDGVAVITSSVLESKLVQTLKSLALKYDKKLILITRDEVIRLLSLYLNSKSKITKTNYWHIKQ